MEDSQLQIAVTFFLLCHFRENLLWVTAIITILGPVKLIADLSGCWEGAESACSGPTAPAASRSIFTTFHDKWWFSNIRIFPKNIFNTEFQSGVQLGWSKVSGGGVVTFGRFGCRKDAYEMRQLSRHFTTFTCTQISQILPNMLNSHEGLQEWMFSFL